MLKIERMTAQNLQREFSLYRRHLFLITLNALLQLVVSFMSLFFFLCFEKFYRGELIKISSEKNPLSFEFMTRLANYIRSKR